MHSHRSIASHRYQLNAVLTLALAFGAGACGTADFAGEGPPVREASVTAEESALAVDPPGLARLPDGRRWMSHLTDEIMPYWTVPGALGTPVGNFPTFRCN